jgi:hypothetical protein
MMEDREMAELHIVLSVLPGKSEAWRRRMQEIAGSRRADFERARTRWGVADISIYLASTRVGHVVIARVASNDNPVDLQLRIAASQDPFGCWFKEQVKVFHAADLDGPASGQVAECVFP